ncbi:MAG: ABC transporter substrate-binding protein [Spirochaetaceae bacterium]
MLKKIVTIAILILVLSCKKENVVSVESLDFNEIEKIAIGSEVRFYMWGGSEQINSWIDDYVAKELKIKYDMKLVRVPMDASVFVNKLIVEKSAKKLIGDIDLVWINGENFKNAKQAEVLYGPYLNKLPNFQMYIDPKSSESDSGFPIDGYELPYGKAQFNYIYDSAQIKDHPNNFKELLSWAKSNPGLFTYPQPPDFTGSAFIKHAFYSLTGGHEQYQGKFDLELFTKKSQVLWDYLNELEPYLWSKGKNYPKELSALDKLFSRGEVGFTMSFTQTAAQNKINEGLYPESVRSFIFTDGSLSNMHYTAIPFNSPNRAGALLLSNLLISPGVQLSKNSPDNWGDFTVLSMDKLSSNYTDKFLSLDLGKATVGIDTLDKYAVPEIPSEYLEALEKGWDKYVLKK